MIKVTRTVQRPPGRHPLPMLPETTLHSALMEIHAADDNPPELFIKDVVLPEELDHLKDRLGHCRMPGKCCRANPIGDTT